MRHLLVLVSCVLGALVASAQSPTAPILNCLRNDTLFWEEPVDDCGPLERIEVFAAREAGGPFDNLGGIGAGLGPFYALSAAQAEARYSFFYVEAVYPTCEPARSGPSNTLDGTPLAVPRILSVDYTPTGTRIDWERPPDDDRVTKYYIYRETGQGTTLIDSVLNGVTEYFEPGTQTEGAPAIYYIGSLDDCNSSSFNSTQFSSALVAAERDACAGVVRLRLTLAAPWPFAFTEARIVRERLGGPTDVVVVPSPDSAFAIADVAPDSAYTLKAIFVDADGGFTAALPVDLPAVDLVAVDSIEIAQVSYEEEGWRLRWRWEPRAAYRDTRYTIRTDDGVIEATTDPDLDGDPSPSVTLPIDSLFDWSAASVTVTATDGCGVTRTSAPARPGVVRPEEVGPTGVLVAWTLPQAPPATARSWSLRFADGTVGSRLLLETDAATRYLHDVTDVGFREVCYQTVTEVELPALLRRPARRRAGAVHRPARSAPHASTYRRVSCRRATPSTTAPGSP